MVTERKGAERGLERVVVDMKGSWRWSGRTDGEKL